MAKYSGATLTVDFEGTPMEQLREFSEFGSERADLDASVYNEPWTDTVLAQQDGTEISGVVLYDGTDAGFAGIETAYATAPDTPVTFTATHIASGVSFDITAKIRHVGYESARDGLFQANFTAKIVNPGVVVGGS